LKIVVTAAGQSKRFFEFGYSEPKFMLNIYGSTMLEMVLDMFNPNDSFLIVTTHQFKEEFGNYFNLLKNHSRSVEVIGIDEHSLGPVETVFNESVKNWIDNDEFIVSYCDFFLNWDYSSFLRHIENSKVDGCVVSFKGLQPASRGHTMFAYLRTAGEYVLEVREKASFTDDRANEYASAGIYYFRSFSTFESAVKKSNTYFASFAEKYVSLVYNGMLDLKFVVSHFPAMQFVCLGTPQDYEEFAYWETYFIEVNAPLSPLAHCIQNKLIPMAGFGERFQKAGISVPKPLIPVRNKAMFIRALESYPTAHNSLIVAIKDQLDRTERALNSTPLSTSIIALENRTSGPGDTILKSMDSIHPEQDLFVMSCDYEHTCEPGLFQDLVKQKDVEVVLFYTHFSKFRMNNPKAFAYCKTDQEGYVKQIVEKSLISDTPELDKLLVGSFWFRHAKHLETALRRAKDEGLYINGELYVANSLNVLIRLGISIKAVPVKHWVSFGDPEEFAIYVWWERLFEFLASRD
jgi:NDP-sugar pyrophosphorylase family protein